MKGNKAGMGCHRGVPMAETRRREALVRELYPDHTNSEVAALIGMKPVSVATISQRLGLKHTAECEARIREKAIANLQKANTAEAKAKQKVSLARHRRSEMRRILQGLPQETGIRIRTVPLKTEQTICRLRYKGYRSVPGDPYTLLYDDATQRVLPGRGRWKCTEEYYTKKMGIKFREVCRTE